MTRLRLPRMLLVAAPLAALAALVASCLVGTAATDFATAPDAAGPRRAALAKQQGTTWQTGFVRRDGTRLVLGGKTFRYGGANIYWLGLDNGGHSYPTQFRINDALETARDMGATMVRGQTLGISTGSPLSVEPSLGVFNQAAFKTIDYSVYRAGQLGLRLSIPLTDYWNYYPGSIYDFTTWFGQPACTASTGACPGLAQYFYTNRSAISAFEQYISKLLGHVNPYTRLRYSDDPTIMDWEMGNELNGMPVSWANTIAGLIHRLAPNQLVESGVDHASLASPGVDIEDAHYPPTAAGLEADCATVTVAGKVCVADEYASTAASTALLEPLVADQRISGAMFWSLFAHLDTYGYAQHRDGFTLHYPGDTRAMMAEGSSIRQFNVSMSRNAWGPVPGPPAPGQPLITSVTRSGAYDVITWRGTTDAGSYTVQRASSQSGPWLTICNRCATDNDTPWITRAAAGGAWYRVVPYTLGGAQGVASPAYWK